MPVAELACEHEGGAAVSGPPRVERYLCPVPQLMLQLSAACPAA